MFKWHATQREQLCKKRVIFSLWANISLIWKWNKKSMNKLLKKINLFQFNSLWIFYSRVKDNCEPTMAPNVLDQHLEYKARPDVSHRQRNLLIPISCSCNGPASLQHTRHFHHFLHKVPCRMHIALCKFQVC